MDINIIFNSDDLDYIIIETNDWAWQILIIVFHVFVKS